MELYRLDSQYGLENLIEGWDSLIWSERYRPCGDFEMKVTKSISSMMDKLPLGSFVSLLDSDEVGIVETHAIDQDEDDEEVLTITGRTFESFFENRTTLLNEDPIQIPGSNETNTTLFLDLTTPEAAAKLIYDATTTQLDENNVMPDVVVGVSARPIFPASDRFIARGEAYGAFIKILEEENLGVRNIRPTTEDAIRSIEVQVYHGSDLSSNVVLDVDMGHFVGNVRYLRSIRNYKSAVYAASKNNFVKVYEEDPYLKTGFDHRVELVDVSDLDGEDINLNINDMLRSIARAKMFERKKLIYVEGSVSPSIPYRYKRDYNLGDTLLVQGDYGISQKMMVVEYIRVSDKDGERGYPTLS